MTEAPLLTILCLASYEKGVDFMRECHEHGCRVLLLTQSHLADSAFWPRDAIDHFFYMPDMYNRQDVVYGVSYLSRTETIDRIVALDDFDVEMAAALREHLRIPGMGDSTARYFRDKLAMRVKARDEGILVPEFMHVLNYDHLRGWMERVPPPWVLKPRSEASSVGIKKITESEQLWRTLDTLGDRQSFYVLEKYIDGDVYHVDSIVVDREVVFAETHRYAHPLLDVTHGGGIFCSSTLLRGSEDERALHDHNRHLLRSLGLVRGVSHTEFIKGRNGEFYFLETSARVGGAYIPEMVKAATGINLWREWARIEIGGRKQPYSVPVPRHDYGGILISLARQEHPDTSAYQDQEIVWRLDKHHHVGLVVGSPDPDRVQWLLAEYSRRIANDFYASQPAPQRPTA
ncbi:MAG: ATP-grasp domain-containing protein [Herpetosiphonaceae bacterium]|nr:ATP-grasp domain-containing protein [Herpetosiphonaceae bacterium]